MDNREANDAFLHQTNAVLKRTRAINYSLITGNIYTLIGVYSTRDIHFFAANKTINLPLITVEVPILLFYWIAPLVLLLTYLYQHYYFRDLVCRLENLPIARHKGARLIDQVEPWVVTRRLILLKSSIRDPASTISFMDTAVFGATYLMANLVTPITIFLFWIWSFAPHDPKLSYWLILLFFGSMLSAIENFRETFLNSNTSIFRGTPLVRWAAIGLLGVVFSFLIFFTYERVVGKSSSGENQNYVFDLYSAELAGAQLVKQPADWQRRENAILKFLKLNFEMTFSKKNLACMTSKALRPEICTDDALTDDALWDIAVEAFREERAAYLRALPKVDLSGFDLRNANLTNAFLAGIDATGADFSGAQMNRAILEGANLSMARFNHANLSFADVSNANISLIELVAAIVISTDFTDFIMTQWTRGMKNHQVFQYAFGDIGTRIASDRVKGNNHNPPSHWSDQKLKEGDLKQWYSDWLKENKGIVDRGYELNAPKTADQN